MTTIENFNNPEAEAELLRMDLTGCIRETDLQRERTQRHMRLLWTQFAQAAVLAMIAFYAVVCGVVIASHSFHGGL